MRVFDFLALDESLKIMDIGAAAINEVPLYRPLLDEKIGELHAFEGDQRQIDNLFAAYGGQVSIYDFFLFDGTARDLYIASPESGMTSLFRPDKSALEFFNGFVNFGEIHAVEKVATTRLDDVAGLPLVDFVKLDVQGAELTILRNGTEKLKDCLAMQLEVSYMCLYEDQPSFGEVDVWMRSQGFTPHMFAEIKRWSIAPTVFGGNFRVPGNQLLESDVIYVRNPLKLAELSNLQLAKFAALAHFCFKSVDLCAHILLELVRRGELDSTVTEQYYQSLR